MPKKLTQKQVDKLFVKATKEIYKIFTIKSLLTLKEIFNLKERTEEAKVMVNQRLMAELYYKIKGKSYGKKQTANIECKDKKMDSKQ
jgi:hypothetical protein